MKNWMKDALILLVMLAIGIGGGYAVQEWRARGADTATVTAIDRSTPGMPSERVVLVSLSTCPACAAARNWLGEQGQAYQELAVDKNDAARDLADRLDIKSVPVLIVGDRAITGFDPKTFEQVLAGNATAL